MASSAFQRRLALVLLSVIAAFLPLSLTQTGAADDLPTPGGVSTACVSQVQSRMSQQLRIYRGILFGRKDASDEDTGAVRYDQDGTPWLKTGDNQWRNATEDYEDTTWTDTQMNRQTEWEGMNESDASSSASARDGIFATKGVLTSELVEPLTQSYRALRCRAEMVCGSLRDTLSQAEPVNGKLTISTVGCEDLVTKPLDQCQFSNDNGEEYPSDDQKQYIDALSLAVVQGHCQPLLEDIMQREAEVLKLAVSYDASYRTLMQFAGNFDLFLHEFRGDVLSPLHDAVSLLGSLTRIPCFIAACNE